MNGGCPFPFTTVLPQLHSDEAFTSSLKLLNPICIFCPYAVSAYIFYSCFLQYQAADAIAFADAAQAVAIAEGGQVWYREVPTMFSAATETIQVATASAAARVAEPRSASDTFEKVGQQEEDASDAESGAPAITVMVDCAAVDKRFSDSESTATC